MIPAQNLQSIINVITKNNKGVISTWSTIIPIMPFQLPFCNSFPKALSSGKWTSYLYTKEKFDRLAKIGGLPLLDRLGVREIVHAFESVDDFIAVSLVFAYSSVRITLENHKWRPLYTQTQDTHTHKTHLLIGYGAWSQFQALLTSSDANRSFFPLMLCQFSLSFTSNPTGCTDRTHLLRSSKLEQSCSSLVMLLRNMNKYYAK